MLIVVDELEFPGELGSLDPLTTHERRAAIILHVVFDGSHNGGHSGVCYGLSQRLLIDAARPPQDVHGNLVASVLVADGLRPFLLRILCPGITEVLGAFARQGALEWVMRTPPYFCGESIGQITTKGSNR